MAGAFTIGDVTVPAGERARGTLTAVTVAGSQVVKIPVIALNGKRDGPTLLVMAAVHGREVCSVGAVLDAIGHMDPLHMSGRVIAIPVANPLAVQAGTYISPHDDVNLSPAISLSSDPQGSVTNRIAAAIQRAVHAADYVIDVHANTLQSIPQVLTARSAAADEHARRECVRFARAFGFTVVEDARRSTRRYATEMGKRAFTVELAGDRFMLDNITRAGTRGILNCAKTIGMLAGDPEPQAGVGPILEGDFAHADLRTNRGGFLRAHTEVGVFTRQGERVATIFDFYGDTVQAVEMPVDGYVSSYVCGYLSQSWAVCEGDIVAYVISPLTGDGGQPAPPRGDHHGVTPAAPVDATRGRPRPQG
ncbi:MAG: succinylglutamate desuccinylase/aspartoacylase family protein [Armatimonadetes bacterium]|nr:succinylglutamate desuccinylase/aspartoacylase family protein [Armatimonadota bacterium]